ncbi:putative pre-mRNA-splicing factor 38 [Helianthus annuus]|nr:putative pre-mRNA-splicing factor 38 [Helianthus annuus]
MVKQMHGLLKHPDSPYIRAVSFDASFSTSLINNCRGPSTAFCLLYKFFTMKLNN